MKLLYCLAASATVHAALFTIISFSPENPEEKIIPVRIVVAEREENNGDGNKPGPRKGTGKAGNFLAPVKRDRFFPEAMEPKEAVDPSPPALHPAAEPVSPIPSSALISDETAFVSNTGRAGGGGGVSTLSGGEGTSHGGGGNSANGKESGGITSTRAYARADYATNPAPNYPERARRQGWQGTVLLDVLVSREGSPQKIEVRRSSGFEILDRAATTAVIRWRFHPARSGETALESWVRIPIVFRLSEEQH